MDDIARGFPDASLFQSFTVTLCQLNECFGFLNPWVFTPAVAEGDVHPAITSIAYAVLEPLFTWLFLKWPVPPWILLVATSPYQWWSAYHVLVGYRWYFTKAQHPPKDAVSSETDKVPGSSEQSLERRSLNKGHVVVTLLPPLAITAMVNAAMLLFAQSLYAPSVRQQDDVVRYMGAFAIVLYLGCRIADYQICKETGRGQFLGDHRKKTLITALLCLPLLVAVRACVRVIVGLAPFLAFRVPRLMEAEQEFGPQQYLWLPTPGPEPRSWFSWVRPFLPAALMIVASFFFHRAFND